jgi:hypothetical protein
MHAEWGRIDAATAERLNAARASGGRLIAVGTTSLRCSKARPDEDGTIQPFEGDTAIFITPGYRFKAVDGLITNFHLPRSTLFMLVSALMGLDVMKAAYAHADRSRSITATASTATATRACCCQQRWSQPMRNVLLIRCGLNSVPGHGSSPGSGTGAIGAFGIGGEIVEQDDVAALAPDRGEEFFDVPAERAGLVIAQPARVDRRARDRLALGAIVDLGPGLAEIGDILVAGHQQPLMERGSIASGSRSAMMNLASGHA